MTKGLVSIIIPCYNTSKWLPDLVASLKGQTYQNFEVIFVDDGSKDDTMQKLKEICESENHWIVIHQENAGPSSARNNGLSQANGEFVYFCDSDDMLSPHLLQTCVDSIGDSDCVAFGSIWKKESVSYKDVKQKKAKTPKSKTFNSTDTILSMLFSSKGGNLTFTIWNKLYRLSTIKKIPTFPSVFNENSFYGEDLEFNFDFFLHSQKVVSIDAKLYYYRRRKGSILKSKFYEKKLSIFNGLNKAQQLPESQFPNAKIYINSQYAISSLEMLLRIWLSDYRNEEIIRSLYRSLKQNSKFIQKGKLNRWWMKIGVPTMVPFLRICFFKILSKR